MSKNMARVVPMLGGLCLLAQAATANAQGWFGGNPCCPTCCCPPPVCMQPVAVPCTQTVPVTEYRECRQTVMKPVVKTVYRDDPVTVYRPVTEVRTAEVPTCTYVPVTEYIPQTRNCGYWQTYCQCCPKMSPCQYDPSPGLVGWVNRTGYSIRMAFTPDVVARRQWIPNYITTQVPVTRMVAQHGVRQVSYNYTRLEPHHETRRVAVNKVEYVAEEIVSSTPVTVWKTVPIGTSVAWVPFGSVTATAALPGGPRPDPISRTFRRGERVGERKGYEEGLKDGKRAERQREADKVIESADPDLLNNKSGMVVPQRKAGAANSQQQALRDRSRNAGGSAWTAHREKKAAPLRLTSSAIAVADAKE